MKIRHAQWQWKQTLINVSSSGSGQWIYTKRPDAWMTIWVFMMVKPLRHRRLQVYFVSCINPTTISVMLSYDKHQLLWNVNFLLFLSNIIFLDVNVPNWVLYFLSYVSILLETLLMRKKLIYTFIHVYHLMHVNRSHTVSLFLIFREMFVLMYYDLLNKKDMGFELAIPYKSTHVCTCAFRRVSIARVLGEHEYLTKQRSGRVIYSKYLQMRRYTHMCGLVYIA